MFVFDTNVLSELSRPAPDARVVSWVQTVERPYTSAIVWFELSRGIQRLAAGKRRRYLEGWLAELMAHVETVPVDALTSLTAARMEALARRSGRTVDVRDLLIAATAERIGAAVASRNTDDLKGLGVVVYDPFTDRRTL